LEKTQNYKKSLNKDDIVKYRHLIRFGSRPMFVMGGKGKEESHVFMISLCFILSLCYWEAIDSSSLAGFRFQVFSLSELGTSETNNYCNSLVL
jgi:hypothetical protein